MDFRLKFTEGSQKLQNQNKNETACTLFITGCRPFRLLYSTCLSFEVHPKRSGSFTAPFNPSAPALQMPQWYTAAGRCPKQGTAAPWQCEPPWGPTPYILPDRCTHRPAFCCAPCKDAFGSYKVLPLVLRFLSASAQMSAPPPLVVIILLPLNDSTP